MTSRRKFLTIMGGGVVLATGVPALWASTRDPSTARRPWAVAGEEREARRRALSYAVLTPNPHNRQPWIADLSVSDQITLTCDLGRRLPQTDPLDRQITIGLGAFLELLSQAAAEDGYSADISLFPDGEPQPRLDGRPVARVRFVKRTTARDPLFQHVLARRTNRGKYDVTRAVAPDVLARIATAAQGSRIAYATDALHVAQLRDATWKAMRTETETYTTAKESIDLLRIGRAEVEANPDGISLVGPMLEGLSMVGLLRRQDMLDTSSAAFQQQMEILKVPFDTAMAFLWVRTSGNSRVDQIRAGRDYVRLNLAATEAGVAMQPFSQALQEFEAMRTHYDAMRKLLGIADSETLQMLMRLGYGPIVPGSPRWPYETRIRSA